jgi:hypothetical protein
MALKDTHKAALLGAAAGAAALAMIGSSFDFWLSHGAAERNAQQRASLAVATAMAPFCVEKFRAQRDASAKLIELRKLDQYAQASYIEKGGWANMPGKNAPDSAVAKACADTLATPGEQPIAKAATGKR